MERGRPRVWGIGLTRTGTSSLNRALQLLGYRAVHWPSTAVLLYGDLDAATDESVAAVFTYLDWRYPGSKFILTDRPEEDWLRSTKSHRLSRPGAQVEFISAWPEIAHGHQRDRWVEIVFTQMTLYGTVSFDAAQFLEGRRRYYQRVREYFATRAGDLLRLCICEGEGWAKLCGFLGVPVPSLPFPHENTGTGQGTEAPPSNERHICLS